MQKSRKQDLLLIFLIFSKNSSPSFVMSTGEWNPEGIPSQDSIKHQ